MCVEYVCTISLKSRQKVFPHTKRKIFLQTRRENISPNKEWKYENFSPFRRWRASVSILQATNFWNKWNWRSQIGKNLHISSWQISENLHTWGPQFGEDLHIYETYKIDDNKSVCESSYFVVPSRTCLSYWKSISGHSLTFLLVFCPQKCLVFLVKTTWFLDSRCIPLFKFSDTHQIVKNIVSHHHPPDCDIAAVLQTDVAGEQVGGERVRGLGRGGRDQHQSRQYWGGWKYCTVLQMNHPIGGFSFLAVQNSSKGDLVPWLVAPSGTTGNQSLHNTTEWT